jgi:hypothetical protein
MSDYSYVADMTGLAVVDISNLNAPVLDTVILKAGEAYDVAVNGAMAYVADYRGGLRVLDVSDPAKPVELGGRDSTVSACYSAESLLPHHGRDRPILAAPGCDLSYV